MISLAALGCQGDRYAVETCATGQGVSLSNNAPFLGSREAPIRLALFGDVKCPHTAEMAVELADFVDSLDGTADEGAVQVQFRHFPILSSETLAYVAEAAHLDGNDAFWEMYWCLVTASGPDSDRVSFCAGWLDLDEEELVERAATDAVQQVVSRDAATAREIGFPGAPGMLLCGYWIPPDPGRIIQNVEALLAK